MIGDGEETSRKKISNVNSVTGTNVDQFSELTFCAQNVQSLNVSTKNLKTDAKLKLVTQSKADVIFLSDTRLNNAVNKYGSIDVGKKVGFLGYQSFFNSEQSSRGVGILLKKSLEPEIRQQKCCGSGNYILLKLKINNSDTEMVLGSIYGPNDNNREFFDSIKRDLLELNCKNIVIGGDWN